jgi:hypothetical protein
MTAMTKKPRKQKESDKLRIDGLGTRSRAQASKHPEAMRFARRSFRKCAETYKALAKS